MFHVEHSGRWGGWPTLVHGPFSFPTAERACPNIPISDRLTRSRWRATLQVPGSGAGGLAGIAGTMTIIITNGKHSYDFEYTLPQSPE